MKNLLLSNTDKYLVCVAVMFLTLFAVKNSFGQIKVISNGNVGLKLAPGNFNQNPERQVHMRGLLLMDTVKYTGGGSEIGILFRKYNVVQIPTVIGV